VTAPLPGGFRIGIDPDTLQLTDSLLFGGSPARVLRLTASGRAAWLALADGPVDSAATGALARRLTDAGLAHPIPPGPAAGSLTVVIPVHDRAELLVRCLAAVGAEHPVLVVDDASRDAATIAGIATEHGAKLVRRGTNGGPAAARNSALPHVSTELIAFLDSDCVPSPGWATRLAAHFADPLVAAVAARVRPLAPDTWAGRYSRAASALDLGLQPRRVTPGTRMSYVPTAALVVRRSALEEVARDGDVFDPAMRVGEDVELGWRLHDAGWRIRYDPAVHADHHEPETWPGILARRARYGTSAAPLALHPFPALTVAALLARRPVLAAAAFAGSVLGMRKTLRAGDIPADGVVHAMGTAVHQTWLGIGRYGTQFAAPLLLAALAAGGRRRWGRRAAIVSLLLGPPMAAWATRRPQLDPVRFAAGAIADDVAYGAGVLAGCLTERTTTPVRPAITWRPLRVDRKEKRRPGSNPLPKPSARRRSACPRPSTPP
jgi:mycofactocin system glycosyltransferase